MRTLYAVVETGYVGIDLKFMFQVMDDATPDEIREAADECIKNNICWHVEDEDDEEVSIY